LIATRIPDHIPKPAFREVIPKLHHYLDFIGFAVFAGASIQILLALQWGGVEHPWKSATIIGLFVGGALTYVVWGGWNYYKGDMALIPFSLIKKRVVWSSALMQMFIFVNLFLTSFFLPIYFQAAKGATPFLSGVYLLPSILSQLIAAVTSGILGKHERCQLPGARHGCLLSLLTIPG
jgi:hypothetical protein